MADFSTLIASIEATIKENGVQAITGQVLQDELLLMVNAINQLKQDTLEGYAFYGEPLPNGATRVVTQNTFFLAGAGSYTINGNAVTITDSGISVIVYDCVNDEITTYQLFAYDANPISGSANAVTSGGVKSALDTKADKNGASPDLFAGFAGNLVDTRSAGTRQSFAFRQSGGDGVNYMRKILGRTEVFNQLVQNGNFADTSYWDAVGYGTISVTNNIGIFTVTDNGAACRIEQDGISTIAGHKYLLLATINPSVATSCFVQNGTEQITATTALSANTDNKIAEIVSISDAGDKLRFYVNTEIQLSIGSTVKFSKIELIDLTLMFGAGNEPATVAAFEALHPLPYYNYNAGVLKNNAATGLEATGFNQWDEEWEVVGGQVQSKNFIPVFPGTNYFISFGTFPQHYHNKIFYDINKAEISQDTSDSESFITPVDCYYMKFVAAATYGGTYNHDICINRSDASRNGTYEPYWKRDIVLGLNSIPCHDENNNAVVVNGLDGVGTSYDEAVVENGMVTKIVKRFAEVDLGTLNWVLNATYGFIATPSPNPKTAFSAICEKYPFMGSYSSVVDKTCGYIFNTGILVKDSAYTDAATFKAAMAGVKLRYELATPKVLTLDNPIPALIEVDNLGTEKRLPEDTADNPQGGFESDSNYSVSVANLVRLLNS